MSSASPCSRLSTCGQRLLSVLGAAVVWLLALGSVSPALHAWLHAPANISASETSGCHDRDHRDHATSLAADHRCAVTLFAQGVADFAAPPLVSVPDSIHVIVERRHPPAPRPASSRYRHPPSHAPPDANEPL